MKKQPVHGCIKDNSPSSSTRDEAGRTFISRSVPRCPTVPTLMETGQWDSGTTVEKLKNKTNHEQLFVTEI